jgi:hypothetical protein
VSGFCENGNEPFGFVQDSEFLDQLRGFYPASQSYQTRMSYVRVGGGFLTHRISQNQPLSRGAV